jgi:hypothetical protein
VINSIGQQYHYVSLGGDVTYTVMRLSSGQAFRGSLRRGAVRLFMYGLKHAFITYKSQPALFLILSWSFFVCSSEEIFEMLLSFLPQITHTILGTLTHISESKYEVYIKVHKDRREDKSESYIKL